MGSIGSRLKALRLKSGLTQPELAQKIGISGAQISRIEADKSSNLTATTISAYMEIFSVSADYILTGKQSTVYMTEREEKLLLNFRLLDTTFQDKVLAFMEVVLTADKPSAQLSMTIQEESGIYNIRPYSIPVLGRVAAGFPIEAIENTLTFVETTLPNIQFALYAKGDSMEPTINDGDVIFIHKTPELENGEIGIFKVDDEVTCKIYYQYPDRIELHSINPEYSPLMYLKNSLNSFQILGKVVLTDSQKRNFV